MVLKTVSSSSRPGATLQWAERTEEEQIVLYGDPGAWINFFGAMYKIFKNFSWLKDNFLNFFGKPHVK